MVVKGLSKTKQVGKRSLETKCIFSYQKQWMNWVNSSSCKVLVVDDMILTLMLGSHVGEGKI